MLEFFAAARHRIEHQAAHQRKEREHHDAGSEHTRWQPRHKVGAAKFGDEREPEHDAGEEQEEGDEAEELQGALFFDQVKDGQKDAGTVLVGAELGGGAFAAVAIGRRELTEGHAQFKRVDGEFGFDFEPGAEGGKALDEAAAEDAIAREHVCDARSENARDDTGEQDVAEAMAGAVGGLDVGDAGAGDHVECIVEQQVDHGCGALCVVGVVAVDEDVDIGVDVGKHAPDDVAFALEALAADAGAGLKRGGDGAVGGVVVVDEEGGCGQRARKGLNDGGNCGLLIVTGDQDGDSGRVVCGSRGKGQRNRGRMRASRGHLETGYNCSASGLASAPAAATGCDGSGVPSRSAWPGEAGGASLWPRRIIGFSSRW